MIWFDLTSILFVRDLIWFDAVRDLIWFDNFPDDLIFRDKIFMTPISSSNHTINQIPGVIAHGLFLAQKADRILIATQQKISLIDT